MRRIEINTGMRYGGLTVIKEVSQKKQRRRFLCICDCGNNKECDLIKLTTGKARDCGCIKKLNATIRATKHGDSNSRLYRIYNHMKARCYNSKKPDFKHYGGRGIEVCQEWLHSYESFRDWALSHGYVDNLSIEREDVDGNYGPENCKWIPLSLQNSNKRNTRYVTIEGVRVSVPEIAKQYDIPTVVITNRLNYGIPDEDAVKKPYLPIQKRN